VFSQNKKPDLTGILSFSPKFPNPNQTNLFNFKSPKSRNWWIGPTSKKVKMQQTFLFYSFTEEARQKSDDSRKLNGLDGFCIKFEGRLNQKYAVFYIYATSNSLTMYYILCTL